MALTRAQVNLDHRMSNFVARECVERLEIRRPAAYGRRCDNAHDEVFSVTVSKMAHILDSAHPNVRPANVIVQAQNDPRKASRRG